MKKIVMLVALLLASQLMTGYSYAKKCKVCLEVSQKSRTHFPNIGIACRDFETPIKYKDGKAYATYRCQYGHAYLVCLSD